MHDAYNQAVVSRDKARAEQERIEGEIQLVQRDYEALNNTLNVTAVPMQTAEQEQNRLAKKLALLVEERLRWLNAYRDAEHAIQRELERRVHAWHGERVHQEKAMANATTPEETREATRRRDHAQAKLNQHERELTGVGEK